MEKLNLEELNVPHKFASSHERAEVVQLISKAAQPFGSIEDAFLEDLLARIGDARLVLLGESTHGTSEFYRMRARITQELILKKGFNNVALEADWPDVEQLNRFVRHLPHGLIEKKIFKRFPSWMWKNEEFHAFVVWLRHYNSQSSHPQSPVNLYGLDLYNFYQSVETILTYLEQKDPQLAQTARKQYACFLSWRNDPSHYGLATAAGLAKGCENEVVSILIKLLESYAENRIPYGEEFVSIFQNAVSIVDAEEYYRNLYQLQASCWNIRDRHMFQTVETILSVPRNSAKVIVWAHNSHVGNAAATDSRKRGEFNLGELCKEKYGDDAYLIGFGTHKGTVAAASSWGGQTEIKEVRASHPESVERLFHDSHIPSFFLPLKGELEQTLKIWLPQRAIGVIYLPENELRSHYLHAVLPYQFDEYIWFDHTHAVVPLSIQSKPGAADTYPFGI
ncbi:erythromycin esterase family protein [Parachlamydia sp. AcF125]|uniref:erythromycin esterase family protein n=1 Tax=Parachlamydia sp. AcF125 TaxID=2795736 RepID=UPI001BC9F35B|nr:erythromycin esterase family protein [Parachlamydia sp. AcF125]